MRRVREALQAIIAVVLVAVFLVGMHVVIFKFKGGTGDPGAAAAAELAKEPLKPLNISVIDTKTKKTMTFGELVDRLAAVDVVCVGELHDSPFHHRVQHQIVKALYARDESLGVGMEMFQKPFQKALDRYFAGETSEQEFLKESEYDKRWGYNWQLYRPIVDFARRNEVPVFALNAPVELTHRIAKVGYEGLSDDEKNQLGPIDFNVKAHRDFWYEQFGHHIHGKNPGSPQQQEHTYQVMVVWDDYMARSAAEFKKDRKLRRMVILAGIGHIEHGFDIPDRAATYASGKTATVGVVVEGVNDNDLDGLGTDYVVLVKP